MFRRPPKSPLFTLTTRRVNLKAVWLFTYTTPSPSTQSPNNPLFEIHEQHLAFKVSRISLNSGEVLNGM